MKHLLLALVTFSLFASTANALVEARLSYTHFDPSYEASSGANPNLEPALAGLGADVIVSLPLFPLAFGLRYEMLEGDDQSLEIEMNRLAALVSWRIIDTGIMVGFIGTYGLSHDGDFENGSGTFDTDIKATYSVGAEAGIKFIGNFVFAGEAGYMHADFEGFAPDRKATGPYFKAHIGYGF